MLGAALVSVQAADTASTSADQAKKKQTKKLQAKEKEKEKEAPERKPFIFRNVGPTGAVERNLVPPRPPSHFNPDPGKWDQPVHEAPGDAEMRSPLVTHPKPTMDTARVPTVPGPGGGATLDTYQEPSVAPGTTGEPVPFGLELPRHGVVGRPVIDERWEYPVYPQGREGLGLPPNTTPQPNRWKLSFPTWQRYSDTSIETPYQYARPRLLHPRTPEEVPVFLPPYLFDPYKFSKLKGDVPIIGQDIFLDVTIKDFLQFEARDLPVPSGVSAAVPNASEVFGRGQQYFISNDASIAINLFQGETAFKPVSWAFTFLGVYNQNILWVQEDGLVNPDPRGPDYPYVPGSIPKTSVIEAIPPAKSGVNVQSGFPGAFGSTINPGNAFNYLQGQLQPVGGAAVLQKVNPLTNEIDSSGATSKRLPNDFASTRYTERDRDFFSIQEAFLEIHLSDLSNNYDFISSRAGIQPFVSDFRGFIFSDTNLGYRVFGNLDNNRVQYNLAFFDMLEKDTNSGLNTLDSRKQKVVIANVYKQDFIWPGYTTQFSFHGNFDDGGTHYDRNGFLTRPSPIGTVTTNSEGGPQAKDVEAYYFGWTGDGHIGRLNINHAFYQVFGRDSNNEIAGHPVNINAQMAALELSYDWDWLRFKLSGFYASGDKNPTGKSATGFDSIDDNPFFFGGPFSWYTHEGFNLVGTGVGLKQGDSLVPDLRSSKSEGQSNFVNPGAYIVGAGIEADLTPKIKGFVNLNYIWLAQTQVVKYVEMSNKISDRLGLDPSIGFKYRPLLTDNVVFSLGVGFFLPGPGYESIYRVNTDPVPGYGSQTHKDDPFLWDVFTTLTLTY